MADLIAREVVSAEPVTVDAVTSVEDAATIMLGRDVSRVPVLEVGELIGIVTKSDVVRSIAEQG